MLYCYFVQSAIAVCIAYVVAHSDPLNYFSINCQPYKFVDKRCYVDDNTDQSDVVQDFVARVRNPTLVVLEWTAPQRPGIIKYRVRLLRYYVTGSQLKRKSLDNYYYCHYTVSQKKRPTFKLSLTLSNLNRFSKFLHCWKAYEICYKSHMTIPTLP